MRSAVNLCKQSRNSVRQPRKCVSSGKRSPRAASSDLIDLHNAVPRRFYRERQENEEKKQGT